MVSRRKVHSGYGRIRGVNLDKIRARVMNKIKRLKKLPRFLRKHKERYGIIFVLVIINS